MLVRPSGRRSRVWIWDCGGSARDHRRHARDWAGHRRVPRRGRLRGGDLRARRAGRAPGANRAEPAQPIRRTVTGMACRRRRRRQRRSRAGWNNRSLRSAASTSSSPTSALGGTPDEETAAPRSRRIDVLGTVRTVRGDPCRTSRARPMPPSSPSPRPRRWRRSADLAPHNALKAAVINYMSNLATVCAAQGHTRQHRVARDDLLRGRGVGPASARAARDLCRASR